MARAARLGDKDQFDYAIAGGTIATVKIDGAEAAVNGSTLSDSIAIDTGTIATVKINGSPAAVVGSSTSTKHPNDPGKTQSGVIAAGSTAVNITG
jgi:uncharacterized Zn-binding protein involved in type VI secretion